MNIRNTRNLVWLGCALYALPLVSHAYAGTASRYFGDDFCAGAIFREYGPIGGQWWYYRNWGAVPTTMFLTAVTDPGGVRLTRWLTACAIVLWVASTAWTIRRITERFGDRWDRPAALLLAEIVVYATLAGSPNVIQSLYLRVPMFEYVGPLIALTIYAGFLARSVSEKCEHAPSRPASPAKNVCFRRCLASALITFVAGSFGPVYVALQTTAVVMAALVNRALDRSDRGRTLQQLLLAGLVGSLAALALVALGPGNAARQAFFPAPPTPTAVVKWSMLSAVFMFARPVLPLLTDAIGAVVSIVFSSSPPWLPKAMEMSTSPFTLVLIFGASWWLALFQFTSSPVLDARHTRTLLAGALGAGFILVMACMAPSAYAMSAPPPPRALIVPQLVLTCLAVSWGVILGALTRGHGLSAGWPMRIAVVATACVMVWAPVASARTTFREGTELRRWATRWDETDRQLWAARARGEATAVVPAVDTIGGVGSVGPDPEHWVNYCAARYYGLDRITGVLTRR